MSVVEESDQGDVQAEADSRGRQPEADARHQGHAGAPISRHTSHHLITEQDLADERLILPSQYHEKEEAAETQSKDAIVCPIPPLECTALHLVQKPIIAVEDVENSVECPICFKYMWNAVQ